MPDPLLPKPNRGRSSPAKLKQRRLRAPSRCPWLPARDRTDHDCCEEDNLGKACRCWVHIDHRVRAVRGTTAAWQPLQTARQLFPVRPVADASARRSSATRDRIGRPGTARSILALAARCHAFSGLRVGSGSAAPPPSLAGPLLLPTREVPADLDHTQDNAEGRSRRSHPMNPELDEGLQIPLTCPCRIAGFAKLLVLRPAH